MTDQHKRALRLTAPYQWARANHSEINALEARIAMLRAEDFMMGEAGRLAKEDIDEQSEAKEGV